MNEVIEADEIIFPHRLGQTTQVEMPSVVDNISVEEWAQKLEQMVQSGEIEQFVPTTKTLPIFILGLVGGAVGAQMLKGTVGIGIAAVAALWAYNELSTPAGLQKRPPPPQMPVQNVIRPKPGFSKPIALPAARK